MASAESSSGVPGGAAGANNNMQQIIMQRMLEGGLGQQPGLQNLTLQTSQNIMSANRDMPTNISIQNPTNPVTPASRTGPTQGLPAE
jgi:hypothetical protein